MEIVWKTVIKTFRFIYVNCFNRLRFLDKVSTKLQKIHFFRQFKDHNSRRKHGNKTNDPIFSSTFSALFQNQSPIFCCPLFSVNYFNPETRINKMVNKHTVNYHPSPSQLVSRIHTVMFLWTPKGFICPEFFLNFFLNLYIPLWLRKSFKFILLRLLQIHLWVKKIESVHFYSCHQAKISPRFLSLSRRETGIAYSSRTAFLECIFSWGERGERIMQLKKTPKLTKVSITSFYKFHHLCNLYIMVYVLLCNNLTSSMLKCEGSLT